MKKLIFISTFSLLISGYSQVADSLIGRHKSAISEESSSFQMDKRIEVLYVSSIVLEHMTNYVCFDDTIRFIQQWNDHSLFGQECSILSEHIDSIGMTQLQTYFQKTYHTSLNYTDGVSGIAILKESYSRGCGAAGIPRGWGIVYIDLSKVNITQEEKLKYLTSINPGHALVGYLLLLNAKEAFISPYKKQLEHNQYLMRYCLGEPDGSETLEKIIQDQTFVEE
jgi:hypothetical protein